MAEVGNVDVTEALEILSLGGFLLDVREDDEWAAGRSDEAIHVPLGDLPDHLEDLPRGRTIVCVCRSGGRSLRAAHFLAENGLESVNLEGGMIAWAAQGQPLISDGATPVIN
ncbi:MAG: rhodanese-like domain-containing protein [Acidimicrobiales bacterium]